MNITLTESENHGIQELLGSLLERYPSAESPEFLTQAAVLAHQLPLRVRQALEQFCLFEPQEAICRIAGYPVDDSGIGPTPSQLEGAAEPLPAPQRGAPAGAPRLPPGDVIAWSTQQDGAVVHDIAPIKAHEKE